MAVALRRGYTKSCRCLKREETQKRQTKRDEISRRLRIVWRNMNSRCYNPADKWYKRYGGRGIGLCEEWKGPEGLEEFIQWARNNGYSMGLSIDRIDNDGNYSPDNCRWVTGKDQCNNRSTSRYIVAVGEKRTIAQWIDLLRLKKPDIYYHTDEEIARIIEETIKK